MGGRDKPGDRIIVAARRLFCRDGIHATGVDAILSEAGAAKMSLYSHFGSKEGLVAAVLRQESQVWRTWFETELNAASRTPRGRLEALFDVLKRWFDSEDFTGCAIMNAVAEYSKGDPEIASIATEHKAGVASILGVHVRAAGCARADDLLAELFVLLDGAIVASMISGSSAPADAAGRVARLAIAAHFKD